MNALEITGTWSLRDAATPGTAFPVPSTDIQLLSVSHCLSA